MKALNILSVGLIAAAMFTTAASARENPMSERLAAGRIHHAGAVPFEGSTAGRLWGPVPFVGAYTATPSEQPGGICDHGDDPQIC